MAIITAYDQMGFGLNMVDTESSFVPNSNDLIPDGDPSVSQHDYDTYLISQWFNNYQINFGIYASQYSGNIWTIESLYVFDSEINPVLDAYQINIRFDVTDDFSTGAYFTNLLSGNDSISGNKYADVIKSGNGNDSIKSNAGNDKLYGESGNDSLNGGTGADALIGGAGNDTYYVDNASDKVYETTSTSSSTNAGGTDLVYSSVSFNLNAYKGVQFVEKLSLTGTGSISATGNSLANTLTGNSGNNTLNGGAGKDTLTGGSGRDYFDFDLVSDSGITSTTRDVIKDFNKAQGDKIDLRTIDAKAGYTSNDGFTFISSAPTNNTASQASNGKLWYASGVLYGSTDTDKAAEFTIEVTLSGISTTNAADYILL